MNYLTVEELTTHIRESEAIEQSSESEQNTSVEYEFYEAMIAVASSRLDSMLGVRYPLPLPLSTHVKSLCYPIAHWWSENMSGKREYVQQEYDEAIKALESIASGEAVLIGIDGNPALPIGADLDPGLPGIQNLGANVGTRSGGWSLQPITWDSTCRMARDRWH